MANLWGTVSNYFNRFGYKWTRPITPSLNLLGLGTSGQFGNNTAISRSSPTIVTTVWSKVEFGSSFALAVKADGTLWAWGGNASGNLGDNTTISKSSPVQVGTATNWSDVGCGSQFVIALNTAGQLYAWGAAGSGQLGNSSTVVRSSPIQIAGSWSKISAGGAYVLAANSTGTFYSWGTNSTGQLGLNDTVNRSSPVAVLLAKTAGEVSAGIGTGYWLASDNTLWASGTNSGAYGNNLSVNRSSPVQAGLSRSWSVISGGKASNTALAIDMDGALWGWGPNSNYQVAPLGSTVTRSSPVFVTQNIANNVLIGPGIKGFKIMPGWKQIEIGYGHGAGIKTDGTLYTWGLNNAGQCGQNAGTSVVFSSPTQIGTGSWTMVAVGVSNTYAIDSAGKLFTWGLNTTGRLGTGDTVNRSSPVQIAVGTSFVFVCPTKAISNLGELYSWGDAIQVGDNTASGRTIPTKIGNSSWIMVTALPGWNVACAAIDVANRLFTWGTSTFYQTGLGTTIARSSPTQVTGSWLHVDATTTLEGTAVGYTMSAVKTDGTLWSWGYNSNGQTGRGGGAINFSLPVQVGSDTDWYRVKGGDLQCLFLKTNGQLWGAGAADNNVFQTNYRASSVNFSSPVIVSSNVDITKELGGFYRSYAYIGKNDQAFLWGNATAYQLAGPLSFVQVQSCGLYSVARTFDNQVYVWGQNLNGVIGEGAVVGTDYSLLSSLGLYYVGGGSGMNFDYRNNYTSIARAEGNSGALLK